MKLAPYALFAALAPLAAPLSAVETAPGFTYVKSLDGIDEYRLDANGLDVLLVADHSAPVVTFGVAYHVGSRNEVTGSTGSTHLLEHLMFKGSWHFNGEIGNTLKGKLEGVGAGYNADTWDDRTNYFETLGSGDLELAVRVESDRMRGLLLRESDRATEMTVVRNEYERGKNNPVRLLEEDIFSMAYIAQPYHHPTIGWRSDIELVPIGKLRDFYNTFYWPNNATVTIVGDFDPASALALVRTYYGVIPRSPRPLPQVYTVEPDQSGPRRFVIKRVGDLGVIAVGYKTPPSLSADAPALRVLDNILVNGKGSRLYRALTDKSLATNVDAEDYYFRDGSMDILVADLAPGVTPERAEAALTGEVRRIGDAGVTADEVATAQKQFASETAFGRDGPENVTSDLDDAIAVGDWTDYANRPRKVLAVTADDVRRVARTYFVEDQSTTGWFVPVQSVPPSEEAALLAKAKSVQAPGPALKDNEPGFELGAGTPDPWVAPLPRPSESALGAIAPRVDRRTVAGVDVLTMKTGARDIVTLNGSLDAGTAANPAGNTAVASLVSMMLDKGTLLHDKFVLAQGLSAVGAELNFTVDGNVIGFRGNCLRKDAPLLLQTLAEELRQPRFDPDEFAKAQKEMTAALLRQKTDPNAQARSTFAGLVFPEGHPNSIPAIERQAADVAKATVADLQSFHRANFGPASLHAVLVGDVDDSAIDAAVSGSFGGWTGGRRAGAVAPAGDLNPGLHRDIPIADKPSVTVIIGQADGLRLSDPDRVALGLATSVLGGGFSAHLMHVVRDQKGLTYGIYAFAYGDSFTDGGWSIRATFAPSLLSQGLEASRSVLKDWYEHGITEAELAYSKQNQIGEFEVGLATTDGVARELLRSVQAGLGPQYLDDYPRQLAALKLDQVNAAIRRHLDPDRMVTVVAGTLPTASAK